MSDIGKSAIDDYLLDLASAAGGFATSTAGDTDTPVRQPKVCFIPTASGDSKDYIQRFESAFAGRTETHVASLFCHDPWGYPDLSRLLDMDLIYVGGGSTANLLSLWRFHGVDSILRQASANGTILAGISAGANCWFEASSTDSFGPLAPLNDGLGFLPGSFCPHYRAEAGRRTSFQRWVGAGELPEPAFAADDNAALVFRNARLAEVISEEPGHTGFQVTRTDPKNLRADVEKGPNRPADRADSMVDHDTREVTLEAIAL